MSKAVRIREHLYAEIEKRAREERRSIIGQLELLLEQALAMESFERGVEREWPATGARREGKTVPADGKMHDVPADPHFKPDFK